MNEKDYNRLVAAAKSYYNGGLYKMSDFEYDSLLNEAKTSNPQFDIFKEIGLVGKPSGEDGYHIKDVFPAFGKEYIYEESPSKFVSEGPHKNYISEKVSQGGKWFYKYDGGSLILYYDPQTGLLRDIITRSNEVQGKRRYDNFIRLVPKQIPTGISAVLCEVMVPLQFGYDYLSRNKANGLMSSKYKREEIQETCVVVACDVVIGKGLIQVGEDKWQAQSMHDPESYQVRYNLLKSLPNMDLNGRVTFHSATEIDPKHMTSYVVKEKVRSVKGVVSVYEYRVDGIVLYMDNFVEAYKAYYVDSIEVPITGVTYSETPTELLVPNIQIEPTKLEGTLVTNVTSNGISTFINMGIGIGSIVKVVKVGMTIPQIDKVISDPKPFTFPSCSCGHQFTASDIIGQGLFCPNVHCGRKYDNRKLWNSALTKDKLLSGLYNKPIDYIVKPLNMLAFKSQRSAWDDYDIQCIIDFIQGLNHEDYLQVVYKYYDLSDIQKSMAEANCLALLKVYKELLSK